MAQKILTGLGAVEYVDVTVPRDQDDTGYQMAFGSSTAPGEWRTPDVIVDAGATMTLRLLVGNDHYNPVAGSYSLWWRKSTEPQRFVRDSSARVVIVTDNGSEVGIGVPWATVADLAETLAEANAYTDTHGGGGGGGAVSSVFGRSGGVVAQTGDYSAAQVGAASTAALAAEISRATSVEATKADLVGGVVPTAQIPALALTATVVVASQAAMLALTTSQVQPGDIAVRTDGAGTFILTSADPSQVSNWTRLNVPTDAVTTVNGQSGDVVLAASDVGAYVRPVDGIPSTDLASAAQTSLAKADSAAAIDDVTPSTGSVYSSEFSDDRYLPVGSAVPLAQAGQSEQLPQGPGTAAVGVLGFAARADHVHPGGDSAGGGGLLACNQYAPESSVNFNGAPSGSLAPIDTTNMTTGPFDVPASGRVLVRLSALYRAEQTTYWGLFEHGTTTLRGVLAAPKWQFPAALMIVSVPILITGLTPGTTHQLDWAWGSVGGASDIFAQGVTSVSGQPVAAPAVMEVWSA